MLKIVSWFNGEKMFPPSGIVLGFIGHGAGELDSHARRLAVLCADLFSTRDSFVVHCLVNAAGAVQSATQAPQVICGWPRSLDRQNRL